MPSERWLVERMKRAGWYLVAEFPALAVVQLHLCLCPVLNRKARHERQRAGGGPRESIRGVDR